jgi:solute carrier family 10 (sodium/bile acid cotransporter), member 7
MNTLRTLARFLPDRFILGIMIMIILAWLFPGIGGPKSLVSLDTINHYGVIVLFFFYGLRLSPEKLKADLQNWRLHITIQSLTFIVFPLLVLPFYPIFDGTVYLNLWLAVFFLATLPSTVSSSVVMVSIARGNIPSAIFNASISGMIGILATPLWMGIFLDASNADFNLTQTFNDLLLQIFAPVILGLILHKWLGAWALKYKHYNSLFDKAVILSIVYESFSTSFLNGIFDTLPIWTLIILSAFVIVLFFVVYMISGQISKWLKLTREEQITVVFCGSKKSLIHGSVMASVLLAGSANGSLFLVPIMIYHAFQLFYISIVARRMSMEKR